jgi:hypothetical protein
MMASDDDDLEAALMADIEAELDGPKDKVEAEETEAEEAARYVREGRRFVREAKEEPAKAAKEGEAPAPEGEAKPAPKSSWKPLWYKDEYGQWDALAEPLRKALEQREKEAAQGIEKHATAAKAWEPINRALEPHLQELAANGSSPQQYVGQLIEADKYLRADPIQAINWLVGQYVGQGWDIRQLAQWMDEQGVQSQRVDPVQQELVALKQQIAALQSAPQKQYQQTVAQTVSKWSEDKPYFGELQSTIYGLIQAEPNVRAQFRVDPKATLDSLYERAQWAHPQIRERILKEKEDQRLADVKRARAAGAQSPRAGADNGQARLPKQKGRWDIEADLRDTLDELGLN